MLRTKVKFVTIGLASGFESWCFTIIHFSEFPKFQNSSSVCRFMYCNERWRCFCLYPKICFIIWLVRGFVCFSLCTSMCMLFYATILFRFCIITKAQTGITVSKWFRYQIADVHMLNVTMISLDIFTSFTWNQ